MDDSASSLGPVTMEPDSLASHNDVQSHHCREVLGALTLEIWRSRNNAEEPRFGGALPRLRAFSLRVDRRAIISANLPLQAMSEGALRSFYRRTAALGDTGRIIYLRRIVLAKR
jgi:hypothetical protein